MSSGRRGLLRCSDLGLFLTALTLAASTSPAAAAVTIGQLSPTTPAATCAFGRDSIQPTVTSGNTYVVREAGTITSWSTNAAAGDGQMMKMKVFRKVADPATYLVVAHDGPHPLTGGAVNTFPVGIPVMAGDLLGLNSANGGAIPNGCRFSAPGDSLIESLNGDVADGLSEDFFPAPNFRVNVSAVFETPGQVAPACKGKQTTILGTDGPDQFAGTAAADVISALGGNDTVTALGANDVVCGGPGNDTLNGGKGKDTLLGQAGKDKLKGGGGKDLCKGGKGKDTATCETEKSI